MPEEERAVQMMGECGSSAGDGKVTVVGRSCSISGAQRLSISVQCHPSRGPKRNELPAKKLGRLLEVSEQRKCHDQICILEGWLWWPCGRWTGCLLSMPGDQPQKISHESTNTVLG